MTSKSNGWGESTEQGQSQLLAAAGRSGWIQTMSASAFPGKALIKHCWNLRVRDRFVLFTLYVQSTKSDTSTNHYGKAFVAKNSKGHICRFLQMPGHSGAGGTNLTQRGDITEQACLVGRRSFSFLLEKGHFYKMGHTAKRSVSFSCVFILS